MVDCLGGWNQYMWLVSCRRQGMLTQGPAPDPKCKLIISSYLTLPQLLDCLICTRNAMPIVLLLQMMAGGGGGGGVDGIGGGGWLMYIRVWVGGQRVGIILWFLFSFSCAFAFCCLTFLVPLFRWLEHDGCCVCFFVFSLFSLSLVPLTRSH